MLNLATRRMAHLNLQLLYTCNFKCKICNFWRDPHFLAKPRLSAESARIIADKLRPVGPLIISIGGGEPLLHPQLPEIVRIFAKDHFPVMICNGWFLTPENARLLFESGLAEASVSVDYADAARHDAQRGTPGAWDRALRALKVLQENRTSPYQRVHMISVVMDDNINDIEKLIQRCADMGITHLVTLYSNGRGEKQSRNFPRNISEKLLELKSKYRNFVALPGYLEKFSAASEQGNSILPCYAGINLFNVDSEGFATRCIDSLDRSAGNILTDELPAVLKRLGEISAGEKCGGCWTSCRGAIETLMYGRHMLRDLSAIYQVTRPVKLGGEF